MSKSSAANNKKPEAAFEGITAIFVRGYKSLYDECHLEIRPLTILAGANSSGKSSAMQPLLLLKQTLEASYDPGPLLLNGPNVRFTAAEQLFSKMSTPKTTNQFVIKLKVDGGVSLANTFQKHPKQGLELVAMEYREGNTTIILRPEMTDNEMAAVYLSTMKKLDELVPGWTEVINRMACFHDGPQKSESNC